MSREDRFHQLYQLLANGSGVTRDRMMRQLEVSLATLKRDLRDLRDRYNAPVEYDRETNTYRFGAQDAGPRFELPNLWFTASEAHALLTMHGLLSEIEPGLLGPHIAPLRSRLEMIVCHGGERFADVAKRIRLARVGTRRRNPAHFAVVSRAVLERKRITVRHYNRAENRHTERMLSPQRLTYYRNNWYLEAWCHNKEDLRRFSLDALETVTLQKAKATEVSARQLDAVFAESYGIYAGKAEQRAVLRFSPAAARWVADEVWHPEQKGQVLKDGSYVLELPFGEPTELVMDILRHGPQVKVLKPASLRKRVKQQLEAALANYKSEAPTGGG
ncbi:Protein PafC [Burkholderiales bacterium]|nr:MAG: YafY family transcriptional regulator [Burkholderiales bacterium]CAG0955859.1 Protein PafC [Burkholderiales bacterium]